MNQLTEGRKPQTNRDRFTSMLAFFNFAKNNLDPDFTNPCESPMLRKLFRPKIKTHFDILEKETVDEIIFRTVHPRNRLMLELMARGAMRIVEVLKIVPSVVAKAGRLVGIHLRPHDLRRHVATFASRSGVPLEIVSKIILRHSNLSTTQIYLGRISETEALKWIETIYS
jgi:integrase/recombinase XerD